MCCQKLQIGYAVSPSCSVLTLGQPFPALTPCHQTSDRVVAGLPVFNPLVSSPCLSDGNSSLFDEGCDGSHSNKRPLQKSQRAWPWEGTAQITVQKQKPSFRRPPWSRLQIKTANKLYSSLTPSPSCRHTKATSSQTWPKPYNKSQIPGGLFCSGFQRTVEY